MDKPVHLVAARKVDRTGLAERMGLAGRTGLAERRGLAGRTDSEVEEAGEEVPPGQTEVAKAGAWETFELARFVAAAIDPAGLVAAVASYPAWSLEMAADPGSEATSEWDLAAAPAPTDPAPDPEQRHSS